ncbi:MAG: glutamate 5-kinase [Candidatus Nanopelagicales bacterium]
MTSTDVRAVIATARRIVVKIGSSSLTRDGGGLDSHRIERLVDSIAARRLSGSQVVVVSSGAIATGFPQLGLSKRPRDLTTQQASASVGQGLLLARYTEAFNRHGFTVGQVLLTADDMTRRSHYRNAQRTLNRLLEMGAIPLVNENDTVATAEIRVGDNDRLAALVAQLIHADALLLLSDVDGLYDGPPAQGGSRLIVEVLGDDDLLNVRIGGIGSAGVGLGGMTTKVDAARIASMAGIPTLIARFDSAGDALAHANVGTVFHATGRRTRTRLLWLAHASTPMGQVHLDSGAVQAVVGKRASLLPAGITHVAGSFMAGDPVDVVDASGRVIARGLVNYDAQELPGLLGRSTRDLSRELGREYEREVIHRDDLILLPLVP